MSRGGGLRVSKEKGDEKRKGAGELIQPPALWSKTASTHQAEFLKGGLLIDKRRIWSQSKPVTRFKNSIYTQYVSLYHSWVSLSFPVFRCSNIFFYLSKKYKQIKTLNIGNMQKHNDPCYYISYFIFLVLNYFDIIDEF